MMATYAAYRHIELDKIGYGKKRVLKPPGGGSSDIFGSETREHVPRRNVRSHEASMGNILQHGDEQPAVSTPNKPRNDSHLRLFGGSSDAHLTPSKNRMKSNIPIGEVQQNGHHENGHSNGDTTDGNPVTGNGYAENGINGNGLNGHGNGMNGHGNGMNGHGNGMVNGHGTNGNGRRVPPGGFSSGLW